MGFSESINAVAGVLGPLIAGAIYVRSPRPNHKPEPRQPSALTLSFASLALFFALASLARTQDEGGQDYLPLVSAGCYFISFVLVALVGGEGRQAPQQQQQQQQ